MVCGTMKAVLFNSVSRRPFTRRTGSFYSALQWWLFWVGRLLNGACAKPRHERIYKWTSASRNELESPVNCTTRFCRAFRGSYSIFKKLVTYFLSAQRKRFKLWTERWMVRNRRLWKDGTRFMTYDPRHLLPGDWWRKSRVLEKNLSPRTEIRMRHSSEW